MFRLETDRLVLRTWDPEGDAEPAFKIYGDAEVVKYLGEGQAQESIEAQRALLERIVNRHKALGWTDRGLGFWACERKESKQLVGGMLLLPLRDGEGTEFSEIEIGWHLGQYAWGHGYATEAGRALAAYGFRDLDLDEILAVAYAENTKSHRVMERIGMRPAGATTKYYGLELVLYKLARGE